MRETRVSSVILTVTSQMLTKGLYISFSLAVPFAVVSSASNTGSSARFVVFILSAVRDSFFSRFTLLAHRSSRLSLQSLTNAESSSVIFKRSRTDVWSNSTLSASSTLTVLWEAVTGYSSLLDPRLSTPPTVILRGDSLPWSWWVSGLRNWRSGVLGDSGAVARVMIGDGGLTLICGSAGADGLDMMSEWDVGNGSPVLCRFYSWCNEGRGRGSDGPLAVQIGVAQRVHRARAARARPESKSRNVRKGRWRTAVWGKRS